MPYLFVRNPSLVRYVSLSQKFPRSCTSRTSRTLQPSPGMAGISQTAIQTPGSAEGVEYLSLADKPGSKMAYRFHKSPSAGQTPLEKQILIVYLNGMMTTLPSWVGVTEQLESQKKADNVSILSYDRFGQGFSEQDPNDAGAADPTHAHDIMEPVRDLRKLITYIVTSHLVPSQGGENGSQKDEDYPKPGPKLILPSNSIGGAISRLYAQSYPSTVAALLLLDSVIANTDFISIYPDPDSPDFDPNTHLPTGVTEEHLRLLRASTLRTFHPRNGSREGLSRLNLASLLPSSSSPQLVGWNSHHPYVTVIGHGHQAFAEEASKMSGGKIPPVANGAFINPVWDEYNRGLTGVTADKTRAKGPIEAVGAGHFVQRDRADLVMGELNELIAKVDKM